MDDSGFASSFEFWRRFAEFGATIVVVGILGEITGILMESHEKQYFREWWDFRLNPKLFDPIWGGILKWSKPRKLRIEFLSVVLVVGGLVIEIGASHKAYIASDRLMGSLQAQTAQARLLTSSNEVQVGLLTSNNLVLQKELQARIITTKQMEDFKLYMTFVSKKTPIRVSIGQEGFDTETFAMQLRQMLNYAGFTNTPDCGPWGVFRDTTRLTAVPVGAEVYNTDIYIIFFSTNQLDFKLLKPTVNHVQLNAIKSPYANFDKIPCVSDTDDPREVFNALDFGLTKVGFSVQWIAKNEWVKSNECEIFIPIKP